MNSRQRENLLLRYIVISFSVFVLFLLLTAWGYGYLVKKDLVSHHETAAIQIAENLQQNLQIQLRRDTAHLNLETLLKTPLYPDSGRFTLVDQIVRRTLYGLNVLKVKIFNTDRLIIYSTDSAIIGQRDEGNGALFTALQGTPFSKLQREEEVWDIKGEQHFGTDVIETYIPVWEESSAGNPERIIGAFEIYQDARPLYAEQWESIYRLIIAMSLALLLLLSVQLFIVLRAEKVIQRQEVHLTQVETALRREQEKSAWVLDNMTEGVLVENANHEIEYMNNAFIRMMGNQVGQKCYKALNFDDPCVHCQALWEAIEQGQTKRIAFSLEDKAGRQMEFAASPLRNPDGSVSVIVVARDITERVAAERERRQLQEKITRERLETIRLMAVTLKHHLFNKLSGIRGALHVIIRSDSPPLPEKTKEVLANMENEAKNIQEVINSLLTTAEPLVTDYLEGIQMIDIKKSMSSTDPPSSPKVDQLPPENQ